MSPRAKKGTAAKSTKKAAKKTAKKSAKTATRKKAVKKTARKTPAKKAAKKATKKTASATKKTARKKSAAKESKPKTSARSKKSAAKSTTDATMEAKTETTKRKRRKKTDPAVPETDILEEEAARDTGTAKPKKGAAKKKPGRKKKNEVNKSLTEEFLEDGLETPEEEDLDPSLVDLDPLEDPVVIDPELEEELPPAKPKPPANSSAPAPAKQKSGKLAPRTKTCRNCGKEVTWTSTDELCFNCLKRNIARKRNDETFGMSDDVDSGL